MGGTAHIPISRLTRTWPQSSDLIRWAERSMRTSDGGGIDRVMAADDAKTQWEKVYTTKAADLVNWNRSHLGKYYFI
jgi:hypothetical protein